MESWWTPKSSKGNCRGQNSMDWRVPYIIKKFLERVCLKWVHMTHLDIWNTSYGQKKGQKSNCQFDFRQWNQIDSWLCVVGSQIGSLIPDHENLGIDPIPLRAGDVRHIIRKLLTRATTLLQTWSQSKVCTQSYGAPKSQ
jgi:hypothetical protein